MIWFRMVIVGVLVSGAVMAVLRPLWNQLGWAESWLMVLAVIIATQTWPGLLERRKRR